MYLANDLLLVVKGKCVKFHEDRNRTIDLYELYTYKRTLFFTYILYIEIINPEFLHFLQRNIDVHDVGCGC